jgi:DNA-binding NarL/FixJ family response regulator
MVLHVCLIDDDESIRADVVRAVGDGQRGVTVSSFGKSGDLLAAIDAGTLFDVALVDLGLPEMTGDVLISELRRRRPQLPAIAFSVRDDDEAVFSALRAGAQGYVTKCSSVDDLIRAMRAAAEGGAPLSTSVSRRVVSRFWMAPCPTTDLDALLTAREREVLRLLCDAASYRTTARILGISEGTVQTHVKSIYGKLGVSSKAEAVRLALTHSRARHD